MQLRLSSLQCFEETSSCSRALTLAALRPLRRCSIVPKLLRFMPVKNDVLLMAMLRLLHNLSFDATLREEMTRSGLIPKLVDLLNMPRCAVAL